MSRLDPATRLNPHLQYGQGIPGINEGRGIGIIETRMLPEIVDATRLMAGSPAWTAADDTALRVWMRAYVTWLVESPHGKDEAKNGNNHETWYDVQVVSLAHLTHLSQVSRLSSDRSGPRPAGRRPARTRISGRIERAADHPLPEPFV